MNAFSAPAEGGDGWSPKDSANHLLVIEPESLETGIVTSFGEKDAIRGTVHDIDAQETYSDTLIFPRVLIGSLKSRLGEKVLARLGTGQAKPGQAPPWVLEDASADSGAVQAATDYLAGIVSGSLAAPTTADSTTPDDAAVAAAMALLKEKGLTA